MSISFGIYLKRIREKLKLSQDFVSQKVGISRPTLSQIENGQRDVTINEAKIFADIFNLSFNDLINQKDIRKYFDNIDNFESDNNKNKLSRDFDVRIVKENIPKFKEVLLYILQKVGAKPNIGETAINKLLYFIDFDYYEKFEEPIIGAKYIKNIHGPTPVDLVKIIREMEKDSIIEKVNSKYFKYDQKKYLPRREADLNKLSAQEIKHIDDVLSRLSDKTATELSEYSHEDIPWKIHENGEEISYESVFYRGEKHSVRNYDDEL